MANDLSFTARRPRRKRSGLADDRARRGCYNEMRLRTRNSQRPTGSRAATRRKGSNNNGRDDFSPAILSTGRHRLLGFWPGRVTTRRVAQTATDGAKAAAGSTSAAALIERGIAFLRPRQDAKGGWSTQREPGVTALVVTALLRSGQVAPGDPAVTKALTYLEGFIGPKGGLSEAPHANYSTSIALVAFQHANVERPL